LANVINVIKRHYCESIIEQKYGQVGCRIFRLLLDKKQLEVKQITEIAMIPAHEARTLLFKMLQAGLVILQEVPRFADHAPSKTFFLWHIDLAEVYRILVEGMYKTLRNLRTRLFKEQRDTLKFTGMEMLMNGDAVLSEEQKKMVARLEQVEDRLEASILHLMDLLTYFEDF
jgi:DNA-directed RNA polymerase III subunit RPC3